jgi:hypothetical protein
MVSMQRPDDKFCLREYFYLFWEPKTTHKHTLWAKHRDSNVKADGVGYMGVEKGRAIPVTGRGDP